MPETNIRYLKGPDVILSAKAAEIGVFTATNATNILNDVGHGLANGQCITVKASAADLPDGLTASTYYYVIESEDDTFQVALTPGGDAVTFADDGSGTLTWAKEVEGAAIDVSLYQHPVLIIDVNSLADVTLFIVGSHSKTNPTFLNPQSATNSYETINAVEQEDAAAIAGDTGIALAAADHRYIAINTNGLHWLTIKTKDFFGGTLNIKAKCYSNT